MLKKFYYLTLLIAGLGTIISCETEDNTDPNIAVFIAQTTDNSIELNTGFPGDLITAEGFDLGELENIVFDNTIETVFNPSLNSSVAIFFTVPFNEEKGSRFGQQDILFTFKSGNILSKSFTILQPEPEINNTIPALPLIGETVIIDGDWLQNTSEVLFEDLSLEFTQLSGDRISVAIPDTITEARGSLSITTPGGTTTKTINFDLGFELFVITDFDGGGLLPSPWQSFGDVASDGVIAGDSESDGDYFEQVWDGDLSSGFIVSQSSVSFTPLIPATSLEGKTINDVFLRVDVNCGNTPQTTLNFILVDGPNDSSDGNVNWQYSFLKETCGWETVEINLSQFGYGYNPSNLDRQINFGNILRIKASTNIYGPPAAQMIQFDNVSLIVK
jgi:hypothetical protein